MPLIDSHVPEQERAGLARNANGGADSRSTGRRGSGHDRWGGRTDSRTAAPTTTGDTAPSCRDCHVIKGAIRALRRHAEGLSAREREAAA